MRELRSAVQQFRNIKREVAAAVRAGDTDTAIEVIESALARVDEARAKLEGLAGDLEALQASQAELIDRIEAWTPPEGEESGSGETGVPGTGTSSLGTLAP
jgi:hypothetical protein